MGCCAAVGWQSVGWPAATRCAPLVTILFQFSTRGRIGVRPGAGLGPSRVRPNGKTRSPRHLPVVSGSLRVPGAGRQTQAGDRHGRCAAAGCDDSGSGSAVRARLSGARASKRFRATADGERDVRPAARRRAGRARRPHRNARSDCRNHQSRRASQELAAQAVLQSAGPAAGADRSDPRSAAALHAADRQRRRQRDD